MDVQEAYQTLQANCGIEIGDTAKVLRIPVSGNEMGWNYIYYGNPYKRRTFVGKDVIIADISNKGFYFKSDPLEMPWPFFCLELIEKRKPPIKVGNYEVEFFNGKIKVYGVTVSKEKLEQILRHLNEAEN